MEIWKDIKGYEGVYQVGSLGKIKRLAADYQCDNRRIIVKGRILKPGLGAIGYYVVGLSKDKKRTTYNIHRLVAEAFIPNALNKRCVNHVNGIKTDNTVDNLEWVTNSENIKHSFRELGQKHNRFYLNKKGYDHNRSKEVVCINTNQRYGSIADAARELGLNRRLVGNICRGEQHQTKGLIFKFV